MSISSHIMRLSPNASKFLALFLFFYQSSASAWVHFTLRGTLSDNNYGMLAQENNAASGSISFDVGNFFRIGFTHRQSRSQSQGYYIREDNSGYDYKVMNTRQIDNSIDLSIILYYGKILVPYIQIGLVDKTYYIRRIENGFEEAPDGYKTPIPIPNGGFGVGIRLNQNFSLKISQTFSQSYKKLNPNLPVEPALDTDTSIGISYDL